MNDHAQNDLRAEVAALRSRLARLEEECRERPRRVARSWRRLLVGAVPVIGLLASGGLLYGQGNSLFIDQGGRVGIGTAADAAAKLDVAGTVRLGKGVADSWFPFTD